MSRLRACTSAPGPSNTPPTNTVTTPAGPPPGPAAGPAARGTGRAHGSGPPGRGGGTRRGRRRRGGGGGGGGGGRRRGRRHAEPRGAAVQRGRRAEVGGARAGTSGSAPCLWPGGPWHVCTSAAGALRSGAHLVHAAAAPPAPAFPLDRRAGGWLAQGQGGPLAARAQTGGETAEGGCRGGAHPHKARRR